MQSRHSGYLLSILTEAITRSFPIMLGGLHRHQREEELAAEEREQAAQQRAAELQAIADDRARIFAQGPSAAAGRRLSDAERQARGGEPQAGVGKAQGKNQGEEREEGAKVLAF